MNTNNISTKTRIVSIAIALVMLITSVCVMTTSQVSAASKKSSVYILTDVDISGEKAVPREKVGKYYVWVEETLTATKLKCAKSLKGKAKTVKTVKDSKGSIDSHVLTNGTTIYYAVNTEKKTTFYKTNVKGAKSKKIKSVKGYASLAGYYKNKLYYNLAIGETYDGALTPQHLYAYNLKKKTSKCVKKLFWVESCYGPYITGQAAATDESNSKHALYNAKKNKSNKLPKGMYTVVSGKTVYFMTSSNNGASTVKVKKCSLAGKNVKSIKTVKNMWPTYFGRKAAYFEDEETGVIKKLTYKTKKLTTVKK